MAFFFLAKVEAQSIVTSKHNLSVSGTGTVKASSETEICLFCHTPHLSKAEAPQWNRNVSGSTYTLYKSSTLNALPGQRGKWIGHTQPRRIAASSVAKRIAEELKTPLGEVVGFKVRFQDRLSKDASVKLMTDGILLAETQNDPLLDAYDTLIIDEAHERSLNIDFLLGYLRQILPRRPDLKIVVTSATIDANRFAQHFASRKGPAPVIMVSGRTFPVEMRWRPFEESREHDLNDAIAEAVDELWMGHASGDILIFLPGEREIREATDLSGLRVYYTKSCHRIFISHLNFIFPAKEKMSETKK
jgi:hypothetical protein